MNWYSVIVLGYGLSQKRNGSNIEGIKQEKNLIEPFPLCGNGSIVHNFGYFKKTVQYF